MSISFTFANNTSRAASSSRRAHQYSTEPRTRPNKPPTPTRGFTYTASGAGNPATSPLNRSITCRKSPTAPPAEPDDDATPRPDPDVSNVRDTAAAAASPRHPTPDNPTNFD
ncbi:hypothetical protein [Austwickia chelonae]|uniref:hypothetical protein n=1 Tax=Austwickia chelonae TaxID=100225 RepID=UPI00138AD8A5|nr:hypothetical protein [Austwickia chelonae]